MKTGLAVFCGIAAVLLFGISSSPGAPASSTTKKVSSAAGTHASSSVGRVHHVATRRANNVGGEASTLQEAYSILEKGDHDYHGHRIRAMHEISAAASHLGVSLHGDGKAHVGQQLSDSDLRHAQSLLQHFGSRAARAGQVQTHIQAAINHLSIALSIR